jgi:hypothetical protein
MSDKTVQFNEEVIKGQLQELVRGSVEETLNKLPEKEAETLTQAARYERKLTTTSGDVTLHMPRLKGIPFETAIIECIAVVKVALRREGLCSHRSMEKPPFDRKKNTHTFTSMESIFVATGAVNTKIWQF